MLRRPSVLIAVGIALALAVLGIMLVLQGGDSDQEEVAIMSSPTAAISFSFVPYPAIRRFMDEDATVVPDAVKLRVLRALTVGGLHPSQFEQATKSWRACNEQRCVGMVGSAVDGTLAIEAVLDGSVWHVSVDDGTRILPPGSDIEPGAFVEAFTSDGATADFVISFDMPLP